MISKAKLFNMFSLLTVALLATAACDRGNSSSGTASADGPAQAAPSAEAPAPSAGNAGEAPRSFDSPPAVGTRAHCVVMGHDFTVTESTVRSEHNGRHYAFCCPACKPRFDANPGEFIGS